MRLFIAVNIPEEVKEEIEKLQRVLKKMPVDVKWEKKEKFHLTLKFLGEVSEEIAPALRPAIEKTLCGERPFAVSLCGLGGFPSADRPRVVWLGMREGRETLERIAGRIDEELAALGFAKEKRKFSAHLTVGRARSAQNIEALSKKIRVFEKAALGSFTVVSVDVMRSVLHPSGSEYTCLESISISSSAAMK
jgi:2'-5' RNA ligase